MRLVHAMTSWCFNAALSNIHHLFRENELIGSDDFIGRLCNCAFNWLLHAFLRLMNRWIAPSVRSARRRQRATAARSQETWPTRHSTCVSAILRMQSDSNCSALLYVVAATRLKIQRPCILLPPGFERHLLHNVAHIREQHWLPDSEHGQHGSIVDRVLRVGVHNGALSAPLTSNWR